jgi:DNA-binding CsgD family transcriptional regulator
MIKGTLLDRGVLTAREAEVLVCLCEGSPNKVIARRLAISAKTVGAHLDRIYLKLGARSASIDARCATISVAISRGMVSVASKALVWLLLVSAVSWDESAMVRGLTSAARLRAGVARMREVA